MTETTERMNQPIRHRPAQPAVIVSGLSKTYGQDDSVVHALRSVDVIFNAGEFTAIMGPSGSGKSTLMHCMAGLDTASSGSVMLGDTNLTTMSDRELTETRRKRIGFIFQSFNLLPTLTARENILLPLEIAGRQVDTARFDDVIRTVRLTERLHHRPSELSGGQQQRVAVARALISGPEVVFADEPTGNLDSTSGSDVLRFLRMSVDRFGQTIIMVTHDPVAASYADRVVFLRDGRIVNEIRRPTVNSVLDIMRNLGS